MLVFLPTAQLIFYMACFTMLGKLHYLWDEGGRYPAEWAKFFGRAFRSGRYFWGVCFVVGEKF